ncbi:hypothetical protein IE53DRAFT_341908 [Violaceomyces palustris]|uniref:Uncharacterized protein n=1 Tax=Violaceomyces palustris TaxID=1673888 RepID=A0ACD0P121_9BASI|nr:hypothetical protein IE53DRAFT_341908 [Violaceomyces palustris]
MGGVGACPGIDHAQGLSPRSARVSTQPSGGTSMLRDLVWGDVQVIHTTDIHGWYQGHQKSSYPEPNYSGDWGDFASFVHHMRKLAKKKGVDLLLVDSGDLHDGAGLSDGFPAGQVDGHVSNQFHARIRYDLLAPGNHELYKYENAYDTYKNFVPTAKGRYVASNVNLTVPDAQGRNVSVPMADRYIKFKTSQGRKVTSLGILFDFTGYDKGINVQPPKEMIKEAWFSKAIKEQPDFFLLSGHMPVRGDGSDWQAVVDAIRVVHPAVPILILGGHTHIRDCTQYDGRSMGLESGRYLETIGWASMNLSDHHHHHHNRHQQDEALEAGRNISFSRSYIDANRRNYAYHAGLMNEKKLDTGKGKKITHDMAKVAKSWNLTEVYGNTPQDYYLSRVPSNDSSSLIHLLTQSVLPTVISTANPERKGVANIVLANSGSQRFDIYSGPFTKNDKYIVSPFTDAFQYIKDVPLKYAQQIVSSLNGDEQAQASSRRKREERAEEDRELFRGGHVQHIFKQWQKDQYENEENKTAAQLDLEELDARAESKKTSLGYVTTDRCPGGPGDDTVHTAIPYFSVPDYVVSPVSGNTTALGPDDKIDVVFLDFIASNVIRILNRLQTERVYSVDDVAAYASPSLTTQEIYPEYAKVAWN